jgi:hypothetical protein
MPAVPTAVIKAAARLPSCVPRTPAVREPSVLGLRPKAKLRSRRDVVGVPHPFTSEWFMKRLLALGLIIGLLGMVTTMVAAPSADLGTKKDKLRELQEFIGQWNLNGSTKMRPGPRDKFWTENVDWSWKFKGDDCWLTVTFKGGKFLTAGEVRWSIKDRVYELTGTPPGSKEKVAFRGTLKDDKLTFERVDPKTKETQRVRMNTAAEGIRFVYLVDRKNEGGTIWKLEYMVAGNKKGESLAKKEKKPECVVSGGLGTTPVTYNGETFYVCCSGCLEAFKENPKKYVDEFKKSKKK